MQSIKRTGLFFYDFVPPNIVKLNDGRLSLIDLDSIGLTDNVSQFMQIEKTKTRINRTKLKEYVDTEFSELTPVTFTNLLEKYNKFKTDIPFYRYRTDDFFNEYANESIPLEYRIEKFFEEFERIKNNI